MAVPFNFDRIAAHSRLMKWERFAQDAGHATLCRTSCIPTADAFSFVVTEFSDVMYAMLQKVDEDIAATVLALNGQVPTRFYFVGPAEVKLVPLPAVPDGVRVWAVALSECEAKAVKIAATQSQQYGTYVDLFRRSGKDKADALNNLADTILATAELVDLFDVTEITDCRALAITVGSKFVMARTCTVPLPDSALGVDCVGVSGGYSTPIKSRTVKPVVDVKTQTLTVQ